MTDYAKSKSLHVRLSADDLKSIKHQAKSESRTISNWVLVTIRSALKKV